MQQCAAGPPGRCQTKAAFRARLAARGAMAPWDAQTVLKASKKEIVDFLQAQADEGFLASHGLVGSAAARAKKAKQTDLQKHYLEWLAQGGGGGGSSRAPAPAPAPAPHPAAAASPSAWASGATTPAKQAGTSGPSGGGGGGSSAPTKPAGSEPETLAAAVRQLRAENPELGTKKLVAEVKSRFPALEAAGIKVGSKEVRDVLQELTADGGGAGGGTAGEEVTRPRDGLVLNEKLAKSLFGVVKTAATKVRGKVVPAGVEGGTAEYKLVSTAWRQQVGPEGPCRRIVLRSKTDDNEVWLFDMPCEAGVAVAVDPFAAGRMKSTAWLLQRLPLEVIEAGKKQQAQRAAAAAAQAAAAQAAKEQESEGNATEPQPEQEPQQVKEAESCAALVEALKVRVDFLDTKLKQNQRPNPGQLAQFLRTTVENAAGPLVDCPKWTKELMDGHLKKLGWDRKTNAKLDGAVGPPSVEQVKDELVELYESVQMMA